MACEGFALTLPFKKLFEKSFLKIFKNFSKKDRKARIIIF